MADLIIRNGTVVDGTGAPRRQADIAIDGDRIVAVGDVSAHEPAVREIDASGTIVTPGWVDIHTHYDGQVTWDPDLAPSSINGVTSIVMGNCGVGFAPARPDKHDWLIRLLEGVEDIPGTALAEGMTWGWESFDEYLDVLDQLEWTVDVGAQVPHAALRTYVMGERGADHQSVATPEEIEEMCRLTESALRNGALGFTTSRTWAHRTSTGESIGTLKATADEVVGVAQALNRAGTGVIQLISDAYQSSDDELVARELELLGRIVTEVGRPMSFTVQQNDETPQRWRELVSRIEAWSAQGADVRAQVAVRPIGVLLGLSATANPLRRCPTYARLHDLPVAERVAHLSDPAVRADIIAEHREVRVRDFPALIHGAFDRMYPLSDPPNYEPTPDDSVAGLAAAEGVEPIEKMYDLMLAEDGQQLLYMPLMNYAHGNLDDVREMILSEHSMFGLSDAGAHCNVISDGTFPTTAITHWTRDRDRGEQIDLEYIVHQQTQRTAAHVGWHDRGVIGPGYLADLNVIDHDRLALKPPRLVDDLPAGGTRLMQPAEGYVATIKRGRVVAEEGRLTGERPGRLQRGTHSAPTLVR
ncbi:MAG: N-acyl-D-amino-acid deacylase family protein [Ilumatobacter sp.]|uniref:N-acyl-D-amino-acid deacylase family protein n=1 Tax=Ilumatobacter sp. TaxID=1967498 RepID=UPI00391D3298